MTEVGQLNLLRPVVQVISEYVANNATAAEALPELIRSVTLVSAQLVKTFGLCRQQIANQLFVCPDPFHTESAPAVDRIAKIRTCSEKLAAIPPTVGLTLM